MTHHKYKSRIFKFTKSNNANLLQNPQFAFAKRHSLNLYQAKAIYSFIPKNACTTLRTSVAKHNGLFSMDTDSMHKSINWIHNNTYSFSADLRDLITANYTFTILRCPFSRLSSLFLDKFVDKTPIAWNFYRQTNNAIDPDELSFHDFASLLSQQPNLINGDIHWRKQTDFLIYENYDDYFDFDDFSTIENTLSRKINFPLIDARSITNHGQEKYMKVLGNFANTPVKELKILKLNGSLPKSSSLYTPETKDIIMKVYESDNNLRKLKGY